jgi:hypothetical protein
MTSNRELVEPGKVPLTVIGSWNVDVTTYGPAVTRQGPDGVWRSSRHATRRTRPRRSAVWMAVVEYRPITPGDTLTAARPVPPNPAYPILPFLSPSQSTITIT